MCDGLPGVVLLVVSFPTNFVKSSPDFVITNLTQGKSPHQLSQSVWESIAWIHLCAVKMHSTPDQNMKWSYVQCRFVHVRWSWFFFLKKKWEHPSFLRNVWNLMIKMINVCYLSEKVVAFVETKGFVPIMWTLNKVEEETSHGVTDIEVLKIFKLYEHPEIRPQIEVMKTEVMKNQALAGSIKSFEERKDNKGKDTFDLSDWWKSNCATLTGFTYVFCAVLTNSPNSCPTEHLVSIFN